MNTFSSSVVEAGIPRRAAVYVRVSSEEQVQGYSLEAQERACRMYCEMHGWEIVKLYRDEGRSARTEQIAKRPAFAQMLEDTEAGRIDVVIVHKLDRFARNIVVTLETLQRLQRCNVTFVSIFEQMDFSTPIGKVALAMLAAFAQYYSDNLSWETKKGKAERKRQGLYNGLLPFGLKKNRDDTVVPDPDTYPGLLLAFRTAADGKSDREVADTLNAAGYRTTGNRGPNLFTKDTVRRMLGNRFYLGELPDGHGGWLQGAQEPVLDDALFDRVQAVHRANSTGAAKVPRAHRRYSLTGLAICGHCGGRLHFNTAPNGRARYYCYQGTQAAKCAQRSGMLEPIDNQLTAYLATFALPEECVTQLIALYERATVERDDTANRRRELTSRLVRIKEMYGWGDLTREAYQAERDKLQVDLASLRDVSDQAVVLAQAATFLRDLPAAWSRATAAERNALARLVFEHIEITDDRVTAVLPTVDFAPYFNLTSEDTKTGQAMLAAPNRADNVLTGGSDGGRSRVGVTVTATLSSPERPKSSVSGAPDGLLSSNVVPTLMCQSENGSESLPTMGGRCGRSVGRLASRMNQYGRYWPMRPNSCR